MTMTEETATGITRKRCRNQRCRMKLPMPVENEHHAFCTRACFESFYRSRCRVCETDLRKTGKRGDVSRRFRRPPNQCANEARKWPEKYGFGSRPLSPLPERKTNVRSADSTGLKSGLRSLRGWPKKPDLDPRIVPDAHWAGMYRIRKPDGSLTDMVNLTRARSWRWG